MAYSDIPAGSNRDYYLSGRGRALYQLVFPAPAEPPRGTPAWWSNEGIIDAWMGRPSRIGVEATLTDADGRPLPVRIGVPDPKTGQIPMGPFDGAPAPTGNNPGQPPAQTKGPVVIPRWATDYWTAYLIARQDAATATARLAQGATWTAFYRKGLSDGLAGNSPIDPSGFVPSASQLAEVQSVLGASGGSGGQVRQAPPYTPRGNGTGGVYIPPPGPVVITTREIYGTLRGRRMPVFDLLKKDGLRSHTIAGGRVLIGDMPTEGYGYGGTPGAWAQASGGANPAAYGLDPNVGVVAWDGRKVRPVEAYTLEALFGPDWRRIVQAG